MFIHNVRTIGGLLFVCLFLLGCDSHELRQARNDLAGCQQGRSEDAAALASARAELAQLKGPSKATVPARRLNCDAELDQLKAKDPDRARKVATEREPLERAFNERVSILGTFTKLFESSSEPSPSVLPIHGELQIEQNIPVLTARDDGDGCHLLGYWEKMQSNTALNGAWTQVVSFSLYHFIKYTREHDSTPEGRYAAQQDFLINPLVTGWVSGEG